MCVVGVVATRTMGDGLPLPPRKDLSYWGTLTDLEILAEVEVEDGLGWVDDSPRPSPFNSRKVLIINGMS